MTEKRCYTVKELQEILGVSRPSVYELLKKKVDGNMEKLNNEGLTRLLNYSNDLVSSHNYEPIEPEEQ